MPIANIRVLIVCLLSLVSCKIILDKQPNYKRIFKKWDQNGDQNITLAEYKTRIAKHNKANRMQWAERNFKTLDLNNDGLISYKEFIQFSERQMKL